MEQPKNDWMKQISFSVREYGEPFKPIIRIENGAGNIPFFDKHDITVYLILKEETDENARKVSDFLNKNIGGLSIVYQP